MRVGAELPASARDKLAERAPGNRNDVYVAVLRLSLKLRLSLELRPSPRWRGC